MADRSSPTPSLQQEIARLRREVEELRAADADRRLAEAALRENQRFLQSVFDGIRDGISVLDRDLNVVRVNQWMERMYEKTAPLVGHKCHEVYHGRDSECPGCPSVQTLRTGEPATEIVPYTSGGEHAGWIELTSYPLSDSDGRLAGVIEYVKDITARKTAEDEAENLREDLEWRVAVRTAELEAVNRELEAFAYSVSHDLRAPLRAIDGFSEVLREDFGGALGAEGDRFVQRISQNAQHMAHLIEDLLRLSRITRSELVRTRVDISLLASEIATEFKDRDPKRPAVIEVAPGLETRGDTRLLRTALENLLGNAWKFTQYEDRPRIEVGARDSGEETVFFVRDNGAGFDDQHAHKLFGAFQRLHGTREFEGTGIGLATVQRIIHRHGGRIWAEGQVGRGAAFYFTLGAPSRGASSTPLRRRGS